MVDANLRLIGRSTPAMIEDILLPVSLPLVQRKKVTAAFDGGRLTSVAG